MKITFLLPSIHLAGGIKCTFELAKRLQNRGHQVEVIYPILPCPNGHKLYELKFQAIRTYLAMKTLFQKNKVKWFDVNFKLTKIPFISEKFIPKADIIISTWWYHAYLAQKFNINKGKKYHLIRSYEIWGGPKALVDETYQLENTKIVIGKWMKDFFEKKYDINISEVVPDSIDFDQFFRKASNFDRHEIIRIGMIYSAAELKGASDLFSALIELKKRKEFQLVLFGHNISSKHQEQLKNLGEYEYHHLPFGQKIREIYESLDIYVMPSHIEGFPAPPMEAMACGCATVITDVGAIREYANNDNSIIIPPKNPRILEEKLKYLIENESIRKKIAENGLKMIKNITNWEKSTDILENILRKGDIV